MSTYRVPVSEERRGQFEYDPDDAHGQGLVTFAGVMLLLAGLLNVVFGVAAIDNARFFTQEAEYPGRGRRRGRQRVAELAAQRAEVNCWIRTVRSPCRCSGPA